VSSPALSLQTDALLRHPDGEPGAEGASSPAEAKELATDKQRLQALVEQHLDGIWRFLRHLGVPALALEDAVQEVFAVVARRIAQVRPGSEKGFLFGTALRVASGFRRRRAIELARHEPIDDEEPSAAENPEELVAERRARLALERLLSTLEEPSRAVFVLFELEGFTLSEIAALLQIPRGTVASRLRSARADFFRGARRMKRELSPTRGDDG
jgi:RNA polymerase sigma-70 factor, ECF subfamily